MAVTPYLYEDVEGALRFLTKAFGFRRFGAAMRGADGKLSHATVKLGPAMVMMGRAPKGYRNPKRLGQATQSLHVGVRNVDIVACVPDSTPVQERTAGHGAWE